MDLKDLNCFVAVAEAYGFRRAAEQLGIEQSAVSRRVRGLEDQLGVSLFERHRGGVRLTIAGRRFLDDVRTVLSHLNAALRTVQAAGHAGEGTLKIGVVASVSSSFLNMLLRSFRGQHPTVAMELIEGEPRTHVAGVVGRELDIAFLTGSPRPGGCDAELLWHEPILLALPADDRRAGVGILQMNDLTQEQFIVSRVAPGPEIHDFIVQRLATLGFSPRIDHHRVAREGLMAMVGLGFGVTLISGAEAGVSYPHVAFVPLASEVLPFSAVWSPENDNPALRRFLSAARVQARKANGALPSRTRDLSP
ncbi:LysR family transcriptional regulator [Brevundimonas sp.]|jgi:DNA-binding transcriptional LysR family regulator|uniref:LysR family transcriptional regulator n=1 Tax=Brevundimonas sp. TaxID=1871086 RepID=UPI002E1394E2|nr:LysR substrate-binding domain-containing protein [Brevundimonas sp.]